MRIRDILDEISRRMKIGITDPRIVRINELACVHLLSNYQLKLAGMHAKIWMMWKEVRNTLLL